MSIQKAQNAPLDAGEAAVVATGKAPSPELETGGILTIDLAGIEANWRMLAARTAPVECAAVVKADAYGCGLELVTGRLAKAGCQTFFVADLAEARRVRAVASHASVYVLNGLPPHSAQAFADASLRPVINAPAELVDWNQFVAATGWRGGTALHVDTGMNRLGLSPEEAVMLASRGQLEHGFRLLMSHLACAEMPNHPMNDRQIGLFRELRILFHGVPSSLANSSGIFLGGAVHCDLVRPGVALYGGNPTPGHPNPMRPVVELKGRIAQVREVKRGETVGYGATFTAQRPSRIAIVAAGYADGYLRSAAAAPERNKPPAQVIIAGRRCPIAGRVSMDLIAVDVTDLPNGHACRGGFATLIGGDLDVDELAASLGTLSYEVLTGLGRRYHRIYKG